MAPIANAPNQIFLFEVNSSNFYVKSCKKVNLSLKMALGSINSTPSVVIPNEPKTVNDAPILIPVSTSLVPISIPLKKVISLSLTPITATPLKTAKNKAVKFSNTLKSRLLFYHLKISNAGEKSILSMFLIQTELKPSLRVILGLKIRLLPFKTSFKLML